jgi:hypothetical protein
MPVRNFFFALFVRVFEKKNRAITKSRKIRTNLFAFMYKCHLTAGCQIVNQTNRVVYLILQSKCKYFCLRFIVISNLMEENESFV